jgi:hypothetical protein
MKLRALILTVLSTSPAVAGDVCHDVLATQGWQVAEFPSGMVQDVRSSGFWSVAPGLGKAGTQGHGPLDAKDLAARPESRVETRAQHGALLVRFEAGGTLRVMPWGQFHGAIQQAGAFNMNIGQIEFRINEDDRQIADNAGRLTVCFRYLD